MNILTKDNVLEYYRKGLKQIVCEERPIMTDLAREEMKSLGIELVIGKAPAAQAAAGRPAGGGQGGGYGSGQQMAVSDVTIAQALTNKAVTKPAFRDVICSNHKLIGTFLATPSPVMTEFMGHLGLDFVCIDAEHNPIHLETLQKMLQGLSATPTYGMVRVPTISYEYISGALDIGADALLVPQVRTPEDMEKLRQFSQYPPVGIRGCGPSRLWDYGDGIGQIGTAKDTNHTTNLIVQIETVQAVNNIDEIVKADFVDMFFIGPGDLSMDMGIFGQMSNPKLVDTIMMIREKTRRAGKRLGMFAGSFDAAQGWLEKGFDMVLVNSELAHLGGAITAGVSKVRSAVGE